MTIANAGRQSVHLITPTWSGDRRHVELMRASIERSPLHALPHELVVQTEDRMLFEPLASESVRLRTTAELLPADVEAMRVRARRLQRFAGRAGTRLLSSIARRTGSPRWTAYTGWHVQQLTKLAAAARTTAEHVVAINSDVVITPHASVDDFIDPRRIVCFSRSGPLPESSSRKVYNWNREAHRLFGEPLPESDSFEVYFDTPFVLHAPSVRRMLAWLEAEHACPWWQALLRQPPRRWSEFGSYRVFLRRRPPACGIDWRDGRYMRFVVDIRDPASVESRVAALLEDPGSHYITIHLRSGDRRIWGDSGHAERTLGLLPQPATRADR